MRLFLDSELLTNGRKIVPIKRHKQFDRITANELCKQAGLNTKY